MRLRLLWFVRWFPSFQLLYEDDGLLVKVFVQHCSEAPTTKFFYGNAILQSTVDFLAGYGDLFHQRTPDHRSAATDQT